MSALAGRRSDDLLGLLPAEATVLARDSHWPAIADRPGSAGVRTAWNTRGTTSQDGCVPVRPISVSTGVDRALRQRGRSEVDFDAWDVAPSRRLQAVSFPRPEWRCGPCAARLRKTGTRRGGGAAVKRSGVRGTLEAHRPRNSRLAAVASLPTATGMGAASVTAPTSLDWLGRAVLRGSVGMVAEHPACGGPPKHVQPDSKPRDGWVVDPAAVGRARRSTPRPKALGRRGSGRRPLPPESARITQGRCAVARAGPLGVHLGAEGAHDRPAAADEWRVDAPAADHADRSVVALADEHAFGDQGG